MAVPFLPVPKQRSYSEHSDRSSQITAPLPPPWPGPALGGAKAPRGAGCCLPHRQRSSFLQKTRFRRGKSRFILIPQKKHSKWKQDRRRVEATGQYLIPLNYPPLPFLPTFSSPIRGAGSPTQQANEGAALPAQLAERRLGRNLQSHQDPSFIPSRCF